MALQDHGLAPKPSYVPDDRVVDIDMYNPANVSADFHVAWKTIQDQARYNVMWTPRNGGHWIALRGDSLTAALNDYETFSNRIILVPRSIGELHNMLPTTLDPPEHRAYRNVINPGFVPSRMRGLEATIRSISVELIEAVRTSGSCDLITAYAEQFPVRVFLAMVDLPLTDAKKLKRLSDQLVRPDGSMTYEEIRQAFSDYAGPYIEARRANPGDDFFSEIVNAKVAGRALTFDECINFITQLLIAGLDTVVNFMGYLFLYLARNPEDRRRLAADHSLIPAAVEELVRRYGLVTIGRLVTRDVDFHGAALKKDDMIVLPTQLHGLDERENADPMTVDFARPPYKHSGFGKGPHHCVGAPLARVEIRVTLEEWLSRIPEFSVAPDAVIECMGGIVGCVRELPLVWDPATTRVPA